MVRRRPDGVEPRRDSAILQAEADPARARETTGPGRGAPPPAAVQSVVPAARPPPASPGPTASALGTTLASREKAPPRSGDRPDPREPPLETASLTTPSRRGYASPEAPVKPRPPRSRSARVPEGRQSASLPDLTPPRRHETWRAELMVHLASAPRPRRCQHVSSSRHDQDLSVPSPSDSWPNASTAGHGRRSVADWT